MECARDTVLSRFFHRFTHEDFWAFCSAFILGIITHLFALTNKLINHDDLISLFSRVSCDSLGRWMQRYLTFWSSTYSMPAVNGLFAVFFISLSVLVVNRLFSIKRKILIVFTSASMVTFYTVSNALGHMYMAEVFFAAMFLAVLGVYFTDRFRFGFLVAIPLYVCSLALYQAYLAFAVGLCALRIFQILIKNQLDNRKILFKTGSFILGVIGGIICYFIATKLYLGLTNQTLDNYNNISSMGDLNLSILLERIGLSYQKFFAFLFQDVAVYAHRFMIYFNAFAIVLSLLLAGYFYFKNKSHSVFLKIFYGIVILTFPLTFNCIELYGAADVHILMQYGFICVYLLPIVLCETFLSQKDGLSACYPARSLVEIACVGVLFFSSLGWGVATNQAYLMQYLTYENCYAIASSIIQSVISHPLYEPGMPIWVKGVFQEGNYPTIYATAMEDSVRREGDRPINGYWLLNWYGNFIEFSKYYLGVEIIKPDRKLRNQIEASEEFHAMPLYPNHDSLRVINGIMVVKISDSSD